MSSSLRSLFLPLVLFAIASISLVRRLPMLPDGSGSLLVLGKLLLVLVGGALLAGGTAYAMYRHRTAQ